MRIPSQRPSFDEREHRAVGEILASRWVGYGAVCKRFEAEVAEYLGVRHVFAVNTGTSALTLALGALGLPPGSEVLVPSLTFVSTIQAIVLAGLKPVFCEVSDRDLCLDPADLPKRLTARTGAILPVHYGGQPCAMREILGFAREHGLRVVEDGAHAFGSTYGGRRIGGISELTCFSFDAIKNITCAGGGAVTTDDDELAAHIGPRRNVGVTADSWARRQTSEPWRYDVVEIGQRCLMGDLNAAIGRVQLSKIEGFRRRKLEIVQRYAGAFDAMGEVRMVHFSQPETFPFTCVIRVPAAWRGGLILKLHERGIGATVQFTPNHLQPAFASYATPLPATERIFEEIINLPLYTEMSDADIEDVVSGVEQGLAEMARSTPLPVGSR